MIPHSIVVAGCRYSWACIAPSFPGRKWVERFRCAKFSPAIPTPSLYSTPSASLHRIAVLKTTMAIHALWVINKAGGLVFSRSYTGECGVPMTSSCIPMFLTSFPTFHSRFLFLASRFLPSIKVISNFPSSPCIVYHSSLILIHTPPRYPPPTPPQHHPHPSGYSTWYPCHHLTTHPRPSGGYEREYRRDRIV